MPTQDTSQIRTKIVEIIENRGPSLPVQIARETGLSILFTSAFLSELLSEKKLKISNIRVGNSPLYFIEGQEPQLENHSHHLKSKEKDAFSILKEKGIIKDKEQEPAIRVALRAIKDFAMPFTKEGEIYWRYFTTPESEIKIQESPQKTPEKPQVQENTKRSPEEINIFDEQKETNPEKPVIKKPKKRVSEKQNNKFFNKIKEFLSEKQIEITGIEGISKTDLTLKVKDQNQEYLLIAFNKRRINEGDIIHAYKKSLESQIPYKIISLGDISKKMDELIKALKSLKNIEKID